MKTKVNIFDGKKKNAISASGFPDKGPIIFSVGGQVNFEGGDRTKADLIKGEITYDRNIVRGEWNYEFVWGDMFFDHLSA